MRGRRFVKACRFLARFLTLCLIPALAQSCAQPAPVAPPAATNNLGPINTVGHIKINGVEYPTEAAALEARRQVQDQALAGLHHESDPIKGQARVILPDHDRLRPFVAQFQEQSLKRPVTGPALDFFIEETRQDVHELADALNRSGAFERVTVVEQNDVLNPENGTADFLVWLQIRTALPNNAGAWVGQWLVRRAGSPATNGAAADPGTAPGTPRVASFIKSVREAALRLGGRSVSGATSSGLAGNNAPATGVSGSGFVVDTQGHVITNEHVVRSCTEPRVIDATNATYRASIVTKDGANDLALLKVDHRWPQAASFHDGHEPRPGDSVVVTGYPLNKVIGSGMAVTTGSVTALTGPRDDSRLLQLSAPVQPGNSGGPLLDGDGHVIGIVTGTLNGTVLAILTGVVPQNVNFAIKVGIARNFLDTQEVGYAHAPNVHDLPAADIGDLARKFTVRIECGAL